MSKYIELEPGSKNKLLSFDYSDFDDKTYCYDLSKVQDQVALEDTVFDLQALFGLIHEKTEIIDELLQPRHKEKFFTLKRQINAHLKSYQISKIEISKYPLSSLIPKDLFDAFYDEKFKCIKELIDTISLQDKDIFSFYVKSYERIVSLNNVSKNEIIIEGKKQQLRFLPFGLKNSRLSIRKNCTNIYNLARNRRNILTPPKDYLVAQFDFKSFQPRIAIALFGDDKLKNETKNLEDIYSYFPGNRDENKLAFISWMFSNRRHEIFDNFASSILESRTKLHKEAKEKGKIVTHLGRPLFFDKTEEANVIFQNYICSIETDIILGMIGLSSITSVGNSKLIFPFHDSLVYYIHKDEIENDVEIIQRWIEKYTAMKLKHFSFPVELKIGYNYGELVPKNELKIL